LAVERFAVERFAVERLAVERFDVERFAGERFAVDRFAVERFAGERFADERFAEARFAVERFAEERFAVERFADERLVFVRARPVDADRRFAVERFAVPRPPPETKERAFVSAWSRTSSGPSSESLPMSFFAPAAAAVVATPSATPLTTFFVSEVPSASGASVSSVSMRFLSLISVLVTSLHCHLRRTLRPNKVHRYSRPA